MNPDEVDPKLKALYQQMPTFEPSKQIDQYLLDQAYRAPIRSTWRPVFALAASLVLVSSLVWYWQAQPPQTVSQTIQREVTSANVPLTRTEEKASHAQAAASPPALAVEPMPAMSQPSAMTKTLSHPETIMTAPQTHQAEQERLEIVAAAPAITADKSIASDTVEAITNPAVMSAPMNRASMAKPVLKEQQAIMIEQVYIGMTIDAEHARGWQCQTEVCHMQLEKPLHTQYWYIPAQGAELNAYVNAQRVHTIRLRQHMTDIRQTQQALLTLGTDSAARCATEQGEFLLTRKLGTQLLHLRYQNAHVELIICQSE
ncbi:hypothetical protein [Agitococcus lubricus]|uniref:Uncharacterized protein n=1 Tax=Agitococcus lubricus TaxID=1077255 RepID=A0A2T5IW81_9GAMM|nr:hypothetical protein [Agitococcus lubricus]PTQ88167.1 hypothetical protein C8N29_11425 [Agitococcus lubricus]